MVNLINGYPVAGMHWGWV